MQAFFVKNLNGQKTTDRLSFFCYTHNRFDLKIGGKLSYEHTDRFHFAHR